MMIIAYVPILVLLVGGVLFYCAKRPETKEVGKMMFWTGLFFCVWMLERLTLHFPPGSR